MSEIYFQNLKYNSRNSQFAMNRTCSIGYSCEESFCKRFAVDGLKKSDNVANRLSNVTESVDVSFAILKDEFENVPATLLERSSELSNFKLASRGQKPSKAVTIFCKLKESTSEQMTANTSNMIDVTD